MSKTNFWNGVARGAVKGWDTGREWERQDADEEEKKKTRKLKDVIVDMLMGGSGQGEVAPAQAAAPEAFAPVAIAAPAEAQQAPQVQAHPVQGARVESYAIPPGAQAAEQVTPQAAPSAVERGIAQAQQQAAQAHPVQSAQIESRALPPMEQAPQAAPQHGQGVAALQSVMGASAPKRAAGRQDENFMNALGALAVLKGDINTAAALRGKAQQEQWDAEDAAVAARMMNDPDGEEMQALMGGILSSALPGVRARRDDKTGATSVYVTDEDGTHEVPLKGQTLMNAIRAKQMLDRGQYGQAVQHLAAIDKTLAERAAQTIQTNLQNLKMAQMQQSMGIADAKLALAQQSAARDAGLDALRAQQMRQSMAHSAGRYGMAQQEFAARMDDRQRQTEALAALAQSEGASPEYLAYIRAGGKYTPQRMAAGGAVAGVGGSASGGGSWKTDPKKVAAVLGTPVVDERGRAVVDPMTGEQRVAVTPEMNQRYALFKRRHNIRNEDEGLQRFNEQLVIEKRLAADPRAAAIRADKTLSREQKKAALQEIMDSY